MGITLSFFFADNKNARWQGCHGKSKQRWIV